MKDFWNSRYTEEELAYGALPNLFFKQELDKLVPDAVLCAAEGEGRNAVYAASKGWEVTAFDFSEAAKKKAIGLAEKQGVQIRYSVTDVLNFHSDEKFSVLVLCYAHFPAAISARAHEHLLKFLKPDGIVIFEAFSKNQLGKLSGGPKNIEMLFSIAQVQAEFQGLKFSVLEEVTLHLKEGAYHNGEASVIRFVGKLG